jgi:MFS family permease
MAMDARRARPVALLVAAGLFMNLLDGTVIATALPAMGHAFGTSAVNMNVGITVYLLALAVFMPASAWVADRFGARRVFACAIGVFTLSSIACALSAGFTMSFSRASCKRSVRR